MLQYPIALPSLSGSSHHHKSAARSNNNNDPSRSALAKRAPATAAAAIQKDLPSRSPLSHSTSILPPPSPTSPTKPPRSPYLSARHPSGPLSIPSPHPLSATSTSTRHQLPSPQESRRSSLCSALEDVLIPGDIIGQGAILQGQVLSLVSLDDNVARSFEFANSEEPAREFEVVRRLGAGSYAVVYQVREILYRPPSSDDGHPSAAGTMDMEDRYRPSTVYGREFAIKCLSKADLDEEALEAQMAEVTIHQSLRSHPNIVTLHRTLETSAFLLLILEYVPGEDLFYFLEQARDHYDSSIDSPSSEPSTLMTARTPPTPSLLSTLNPSQLLSHTRLRLISSMFAQMCDAVAACHSQQVYHRDIKPENFIVTDGWTTNAEGHRERKVVVKLTDFGLSTTDEESSDMDCGSAPYMSYECRNNAAPTYRPGPADVWSLGIVLINMLYHYNPWTDTSHGQCHTFDLYRQAPINFFMQRFAGMTRPVAEYLAKHVFNILDEDDLPRTTAAEFGAWVRELPELFSDAPIPMARHARSMSTSSTQGFPISSSTPASHRPTSRQPSYIGSAIRTPAMQSRSLSRAPSFGPAIDGLGMHELSTVIDQDVEEEEDQDKVDDSISIASRSTSNTKRRKRGARKGKGGAPPMPSSDTLVELAAASESLAREVSRASKVSRTSATTTSTSASTKSRRKPVSREPVSLWDPAPLVSGTRQSDPPALASQSSVSVAQSTSTGPSVGSGSSVVNKKPSKWKLSFGKAHAAQVVSAGGASPVDEAPSKAFGNPSVPEETSTVSNVTDVLMGLNAPVPSTSNTATVTNSPTSSFGSEDSAQTWVRGRRARDSPSPYSSRSNTRSRGPIDQFPSSPLPGGERRSERAVSPTSTRSGRPVASSASSVTSSNWRSSMSSVGASTSQFTRYSNSSMRSVSTAATSVSGQSWRTGASKASNGQYAPGAIPRNVKLMEGIPWQLDQLPRQQHINPSDADFSGQPPAGRKPRTRKPKDPKLDTITERPLNAAGGKRSPEMQRRMDPGPPPTSMNDLFNNGMLDLSGEDADGPKKVQKGQINALAKMLSALRR